MNRIEALYSCIRETDRVVDVGCDQAKLSLMLAERKQPSIAVDKSKKVIEKAKKNIDNPLIDLRVSDGLTNVKEGEADTLVMAGMGAHTILEIVKNTNLLFDKILTISNNHHDLLRTKMNELYYDVSKELIVKEKGVYYNLIEFKPGKSEYTEDEILLGLNHEDKEIYIEYLEYLLDKYNKIQETSKSKNKKINKLIELIDNKIKTA